MNGVAAALRSVIFELARAVLTVIFALIALLTFPFPPLVRYRIITTWSRLIIGLASAVCGIRYRVVGLENLPASPSIILSKHQSAWETLAYQVLFPPQVWVLKRSLLRVPFFGWGLAMMNPIAIDRGSGARALKQTLEQGRQRLADGWWIVIFPEGTRTAPGARGRYHVGGAWLACQTGAKVVPVAHNAGTVWGRNRFVKYPGEITVSVGPAIDPKGLEPEELNSRVERWIEGEVARLGSARG
ncbi:MAG TPA: lysophospholipid acyltransferase family protein [Burkholderiales bacterium]|jgi:1-acyl-sn-glycerol-3-phosphate acyltransferase|nr:lysophospholipid acyltransferase family protein [Burkholderiales bacterium]